MRKTYRGWFWRLNDIEEGKTNNVSGSKTLTKVKTMYLELKLREA